MSEILKVSKIEINNIEYSINDIIDMYNDKYERYETIIISDIFIRNDIIYFGMMTAHSKIYFGNSGDVRFKKIRHTRNPLYLKTVRLKKFKNIFNL